MQAWVLIIWLFYSSLELVSLSSRSQWILSSIFVPLKKTLKVQGMCRKTDISKSQLIFWHGKLLFLWFLLWYWSVLMPKYQLVFGKYQLYDTCLELSMFFSENKTWRKIHCASCVLILFMFYHWYSVSHIPIKAGRVMLQSCEGE